MTRFGLIAAAAALGIALLGGAILAGGSRQPTQQQAPVPTPLPAPTAAAQTGPADAELRASWLAEVGASDVLGNGAGRVTLRVTPEGTALYFSNLGPANVLRSTVTSTGDNQLRLELDSQHGDCPKGAAGTYRWSLSPDRSLLTMENIDDTCAARVEAVARTWGRSLLEGTTVGAGFVTQMDPTFKVVLPDLDYQARTDLTDFVEIGTASGYSLMAFKNPQPFVDACSTAEERVPWKPGAAAFIDAFRANDAFEVSDATSLTIDGHPAVHVTIGGKKDYARCPGQALYEYTPKDCNCHFIVGQGDADSMYLVDIGEDTYMFIISPISTAADEQRDIASSRSPTALPAMWAPGARDPAGARTPSRRPHVTTLSLRASRAALIAVAIVAMTAGSASATPPGPNGRIAFMRFDTDGQFQIWTANPDLTHQVQITFGPSDNWMPNWSPDGTRIAFASHRSDPDPTDDTEIMDVYTMRPDGSDVRKVTDSVGYNGNPSWSPDGKWLVFASDRASYPAGQGIYRIRSDGSGQPVRVTKLPAKSAWQELARYSPDGSRIAFSEYRGGREIRMGRYVAEQAALFTVKPDGTDLRQLTPWGIHATDADWSPDGRRLVFAAQPTHIGNIGDVGIVNADGTHLVDITTDHGFTGPGNDNAVWYEESFNPAWSPDGTTIIFSHASYTAEDGFFFGLQVMSPDGSNRHYAGDGHGEEHQADWGSVPLVP